MTGDARGSLEMVDQHFEFKYKIPLRIKIYVCVCVWDPPGENVFAGIRICKCSKLGDHHPLLCDGSYISICSDKPEAEAEIVIQNTTYKPVETALLNILKRGLYEYTLQGSPAEYLIM